MKTIVMVCRSEDEMPQVLVQLVRTLFPECEIRTVHGHRPLEISKSLRMGGLAAAVCHVQKNVCGGDEPERCIQIDDPYEWPLVRSMFLSN